MALTVNEIISECLAVLNATPGAWGGTNPVSSDPLFTVGEVSEAVYEADAAVVGVILDTAGHRYRNAYRTLISVNNDSLIPTTSVTSGSPPVTVITARSEADDGGVLLPDGNGGFTLGTPVSQGALRALRSFPLSITLDSNFGYYNIHGNILSFMPAGGTAKVEVLQATIGGTNLSAPPEYKYAVTCGALAILFPKEGSNVEAANHFGTLFSEMLKLIRSGQTSLPKDSPFSVVTK